MLWNFTKNPTQKARLGHFSFKTNKVEGIRYILTGMQNNIKETCFNFKFPFLSYVPTVKLRRELRT